MIRIAMAALALCAALPLAGMAEEGAKTTRPLDKIERKIAKIRAGKPGPSYDKPKEALQFYLDQRTGGAPIDPQKYVDAMELKLAGMKNDPARAVGDVASWTELGPGNIGGRTRTILISRANANNMWTAGVGGGVWRSTDAGANWFPVFDLEGNIAVTTMAFQQQGTASENPNVIYAGTGEGFFNVDAIRGAGIWKSTDGGTTWTQLAATNNSNFYYVNKIVTSPSNANRIWAATWTGVWRSTDGGANWTNLLNWSGVSGGALDLAIRTDTSPDDTVFASAGNFDGSATRGVWRTIDSGTNWTQVVSPTVPVTASSMGRLSLAIAPSDQNYLYALVASTSTNGVLNVYRSTDGGASWATRISGAFDQTNPKWLLLSNPVIANLTPCGFGPSSFGGQGWYDNIIAVAPHNRDVVFAGGVDSFRSDDGGATWGLISYWWFGSGDPKYNHADNHAIVFHPSWNGTSNQTMFTGNDGGVLRTTNALGAVATGGTGGFGICGDGTDPVVNWTSLNNSYGVTQFYHGRPFPNGTTYFGGTQDNGTLIGSDGTGLNNWFELLGGDGGYVEVNPLNTNILFASNTGQSLQRSTDGGVTWGSLPATGDTGFLFIHPFRLDPSNPNIMWYGAGEPYSTTNASSAGSAGAITWTQRGSNSNFASAATALAIDPNNSNRVFYGTGGGQIYRNTAALSATSATTWSDVALSGAPYVSWLEVDPNDATGNTVYATSSEFGVTQVWRSTNGGTSFSSIDGDLPDLPVHSIRVQPGAANILWIGTDLGVFRSTNTGTNWVGVNSPGFANTVCEALEFQDDNTLFVFTHGRGAWRAQISGASVRDWKELE
ncbi:MAG: sialidase family protein [Candidatus Sumerlaeia bacterium]|nr:sialidase family protein [Candidatus Sumerlaeia bacterium]